MGYSPIPPVPPAIHSTYSIHPIPSGAASYLNDLGNDYGTAGCDAAYGNALGTAPDNTFVAGNHDAGNIASSTAYGNDGFYLLFMLGWPGSAGGSTDYAGNSYAGSIGVARNDPGNPSGFVSCCAAYSNAAPSADFNAG